MSIIYGMDQDTQTYSIEELASLSGHALRTVRYYIQQGLVSRPTGEKRAARYSTNHLEQLLTIRKWQAAGLSLERIRELLVEPESGVLPPPLPRKPGSLEVWSHLFVSDGVEISLEPGRAGLSPEQVRAFTRGVMTLFESVKSSTSQAEEGQSHE